MLRARQAADQMVIVVLALMFLEGAVAYSQTTPPQGEASQTRSSAANPPKPAEAIVVPAGTQVAMVLTHPLDSKSFGRAGEIYAQLTAPVVVDGRVVIPAGAFVQGRVEKLLRRGARGEFLLKSLLLIFPDGYAATLPGPTSLQTTEGTVWINPSGGAKAAALAAPAAGLGLGTWIGSAARTTHTSTLGGMTFTTRSPKALAIGGTVGLLVGGAIALALVARSHQYYVEAGSPMQMIMPRPWTIAESQISPESAQ